MEMGEQSHQTLQEKFEEAQQEKARRMRREKDQGYEPEM